MVLYFIHMPGSDPRQFLWEKALVTLCDFLKQIINYKSVISDIKGLRMVV